MGTSLIHDPEDASGRGIRFTGHDLVDESMEWCDSIRGFYPTEDFGPMDIQCSKICPRTAPVIFVLDPLSPSIGMDFTGMKTSPRLDACFFVRRKDVFVLSQRPALPDSLVQVQNGRRSLKELRVSRPDPGMMPPWFQDIRIQDPPDRRATDRGDRLLLKDDPLDVRNEESAQWLSLSGRQFTSDGFYQGDLLRGKKPSGAPDEDYPAARTLFLSSVFATFEPSAESARDVGPSHC